MPVIVQRAMVTHVTAGERSMEAKTESPADEGKS